MFSTLTDIIYRLSEYMDLVYCSSDSLLPKQQQQQVLQQPKLIQQQSLMIKRQTSHSQQQIQQVQHMNEVNSCNEKSHDNYNDDNNARPSTQIKQIQVSKYFLLSAGRKKIDFKLLVFFFVKKACQTNEMKKCQKIFIQTLKLKILF